MRNLYLGIAAFLAVLAVLSMASGSPWWVMPAYLVAFCVVALGLEKITGLSKKGKPK